VREMGGGTDTAEIAEVIESRPRSRCMEMEKTVAKDTRGWTNLDCGLMTPLGP